ALSHAVPLQAGSPRLAVYFGGGPQIPLGDSLVTLLVQRLMLGRAAAVSVHPVAFAGWVGMLVTMLNLLPISQLDGGHILYATLPRWHQRIAFVFWCVIILLGRWWWGWYLWALLVVALSRGRLGHPPVLDAQRPLPPSRRVVAWGALGVFLVTFAPVPFRPLTRLGRFRRLVEVGVGGWTRATPP